MLRILQYVLLASSLFVSTVLTANSAGAQEAMQQAMARSQETGRPVLALATREACGNCRALKRHIQSDAELQAIMSEFVILPLDVDNGADWGAWAQQFPPQGTTLPFVYVVSAGGQEMGQLNGGQARNQLKPALAQSLQLAAQQNQQAAAVAEEEQRAAEQEASIAAREAREATEENETAELAEPEEESETTPATEEQTTGGEDDETEQLSSVQIDRRLDGWLRMATSFADTRPEKTREYVQRILDLDPQSRQATAARALLRGLN